MCGGSGGSTVSNEFSPPGYTVPWWEQYTANAGAMSGQPYTPSGIPTVAPWNDYNQLAANMTYDRATQGAPDLQAGRGAITSVASGQQQNPWQAFLAGPASGENQNPFMAGAQALYEGGDNPYMVNPDKVIEATAADMTRAAQKGPMAQLDAAANRQGAYGGSGYNELQSGNAGELARGIGSMSANARLAANAQNANTWQQAQAGKLGAIGVGGQQFGQSLQQQIAAAVAAGQMSNADVQNMLSAAGLSVSTSGTDWTDIANLNNMGSAYGAYQQALLNSGNEEFARQQMWPYTQNELLGGALSRASGGQGGGGSSSVYGPSPNYWANAAGLGLTAYGLSR